MSKDLDPDHSRLVRELCVGDRMSLDGGRVVLRVEARNGRRLGVVLSLHRDVIVDRPRVAANDLIV